MFHKIYSLFCSIFSIQSNPNSKMLIIQFTTLILKYYHLVNDSNFSLNMILIFFTLTKYAKKLLYLKVSI